QQLIFLAFLLVLILTPFFHRLALFLKIVDRPTPLKSHEKAVPYLGGMALLLSVLLPVLLIALLKDLVDRKILGILIGSLLIAILGLLDDIKNLSPYTKFFGQGMGALILILSGVHLEIIYFPLWLNLLLTFLWILGITNGFNIIDVMDGLSAGVACIASAAFLFIAIPTQNVHVVLLSAALAGGTLGFLRFNFYPARIFMGDSGSLFLGFLLASLSITVSYTAVNNIALLSPLLILAVPIYDTFLVSLLRILKGRNPFRGSSDHFALRLRALGMKDSHVVLIIYVISIALCEASYIATTVNFYGAVFIYLLVIGILATVGRNLSRVKFD
ncbi:undecaprenyl/decaprenyl-phosphate alpha-N-acetylglucosaminyl 1-phosphate transferase, partial [candidate division TA06 bacterium]|nr:undecaprenyl/decaprenyl-phosphate alpha-N-acetylglucosaminyl 1-phosphate transferase [candidate division TA06 bacterium]